MDANGSCIASCLHQYIHNRKRWIHIESWLIIDTMKKADYQNMSEP